MLETSLMWKKTSLKSIPWSHALKLTRRYTQDLSDQLDLGCNSLPSAILIPTLLNPLFGMKKHIIGSSLMTETQYARQEKAQLLNKIQDILDLKSPPLENDSAGDSDSDDVDAPRLMNFNHQKAEV